MIRALLATTAVAAFMTVGVFAQTTTQEPMTTEPAAPAAPAPVTYDISDDPQLVSNLMGAAIYTAPSSDAETIGNVSDLVIDANGQIIYVVVGVGGFLGIGEKQVALPFDQIDWALIPDTDDYQFVIQTTREDLEASPEFNWEEQRATIRTQPADTETMTEEPATGAEQPATDTAPEADVEVETETDQPATEPSNGETTTQ